MTDVESEVRRLLDPPLPLPGHGRTRERWQRLSDAARNDVVVGRLLEANADADAILAELTDQRVEPSQWWGVWAAEPPQPVLTAERRDNGWVLTGGKAWCSGAGMCTHALVTARHEDARPLFAVDLAHSGVSVDVAGWKAAGMGRSATGTVTFDGVPAHPVGPAGSYLDRAGFWHGGAGVAACWLGGAQRVADTLVAAASRRPLDEHARAHLGAVDAALTAAQWSLDGAAAEVDAAPDDRDTAQQRATRVRVIVESAASLTLERVGRALGAAPLALDADHTTAVSDLTVYLRQSHAERDLAVLGQALVTRGGPVTGSVGPRLGVVDDAGRGTPAAAWDDWLPGHRELDVSDWRTVVVVAPHPDDEVLGVGGLMARLVAQGVDVQVVAVTDGGAARPPAGLAAADLRPTRVAEAALGCGILGVRPPRRLEIPDGAVAAHEDELTDRLSELLGPQAVCLATWACDGHPDHEAAGRAAARAAARTGARLVAYPVWMWHWAHPGSPSVPWSCARTIELTHTERDLKERAVQCHRSQLEPPEGGGSPVLPPFVIDRLVTSRELVLL